MRRIFATVVFVISTFSVVTPVTACSGTRLIDDDDPPADYVFTGTVIRLDDPSDGMSWSTGDLLSWTFFVDDSQTGNVSQRMTIGSMRDGAACGFEFQLGHRYLVRASQAGSDSLPTVWLGSGTRELEPLAQPPRVEGKFTSPFSKALTFVPLAIVGVFLTAIGAWVFRRREPSAGI